MNHSVVTRYVLSLAAFLFLAATLSAQAVPDRDVSQIRINGLKIVSPQTIRHQLACLPEIVEASHSSLDYATYTFRVREAVARGMLASGFFDSRVALTEESGQLTLTIKEGPRFHCGTITIEGASEETNDWIRSQLQIASAETDDAEPVWQSGTPTNGTPRGKLHWSHEIQQRLNEIGLQGDGAVIDLVRNDEAKTLDLHLSLSATDATVEVSVQDESNDDVAEPNDQGSGTPTSPDRVSGELQQIHRRLFSSPMSGIRLRGTEDNWTCELILGPATVTAMIENESQRRRAVLDHGEVLISMDDPPAAIRVPVLNASVVLQVESSEESDGKTIRLTLDGDFVTDELERPVRAGVVFTKRCWTEWFPPGSTERSEDEQGVTYSHASHCLRLDHQGRLIELSGIVFPEGYLSLTPIEEVEIEKIAEGIIQAADPIELFVRDQDTGRQISLKDILFPFTKIYEDDADFHIPPAGGQRDAYGALLLALVRDGAFGEPESLPVRLARLCALEISGNRLGLRERLAEIEPDALKGPISSAIVATLCALQDNDDWALNHFRHAQSLAGDSEAVQHDMVLLLDSNNLIGRVCEHVDLKRWSQQAALLGAPFAEDYQIAIFDLLADNLPDSSTNQERSDNVLLLLTVAYELVGQRAVEDYCAGMIQMLESRQQEIAERQSPDEKKQF